MSRLIYLFQRLFLMLSTAFIFSAFIFAQQQVINIEGKVVDEAQIPIPGATILIKDTQTGTITNADGKFLLNSVSANAILVVRFVGYATQEVSVSPAPLIILSEDKLQLEEVQVIAYGTQNKATITGAIASVQTNEIIKTPSANIANTLAGELPGIMTVQTSGQPGSEDPRIYIRGSATLNDNASSPLILVDGVERSFSDLDPNEIADITILKDASATAVFGVRGANGVILVTTRRGKEGKAVISISSSTGVQQPTRVLELADSYTWATMYDQMMEDDGELPVFTDKVKEAFRTNSNPILYPNVDWNDYILRDISSKTQHNMNVSGGTKDLKYFVSFGYLHQDGIIKNFGQDYNNNFSYDRFNYRSNVDVRLTNTTMLKVNLGGRFGIQNEPRESSNQNIWGDLMESKPFASPGIIDGRYILGNDDIITAPTALKNPLQDLYGAGFLVNYRNAANIDLELNQDLSFIIKGLEFSVKGSYNSYYNRVKTRYKSIEKYIPWEQGMIDGASNTDPNYDSTIVYSINGVNNNFGYSENTSGYSRDWYLETKLFYQRNFNNHKVTALALFNESKNYYPSAPRYIPRGYLGLVGRTTYSFKNKYMLDLNVGYNGSENFAPGKTRYGLFPAFSAGYALSEEPFMQNIEFISYLKFRGSYGFVGNDRGVSRFMYLSDSWNPVSGNYDFSLNPNPIPSASEGRVGNPDVTWETAEKQNYGIDINFFDAKLSINADYFIEKRSDILIVRNTAPREPAIQLPNINMGIVENKGYELKLEWRDEDRTRDFNYYINTNVSYARNKIIEKDEIPQKYDYMEETGGPTGRPFGYEFEKFYEEEDFNPDGSLIEELPQSPGSPIPGDPMYRDLNSDGVIDGYDKLYHPYGRRPEYVFGLNFGFNLKGFSLSTRWTGVTHVTRNLERNFRMPFGIASGSRSMVDYYEDNVWTPERGQDALFPRMTIKREPLSYADSDLYLWDASYFRLRNLYLSYTFKNSNTLKILGVSNLEVYFNGLNLLTFDYIKFFDPEMGTSNLNTEESVKYPIMKMYNLGLNIKFK